MRRFSHWTPRYFYDRLSLALYEKAHPGEPWIAQEATAFLSTWLRSNDAGFEFGSGRSSLWLASRVARLTSVEHDSAWHGIVKGKRASLKNVDSRLFPQEASFDEDCLESPYSACVSEAADASLDFVLVDGIFRGACALASLPKLRPGGILIVDDCQRYIVYPTRSPYPVDEAGLPPAWRSFAKLTASWRRAFFVNGVSDTAVLFKPGSEETAS